MANMHIRSSECAWHHSTVNILGRNLVGITAWEFKKEVEKTAEYGAGQKANPRGESNSIKARSNSTLPMQTSAISYTTLSSHPSIRSSERLPKSISINTHFLPSDASAIVRLAATVDLPTPPLQEVTNIVLVISEFPPIPPLNHTLVYDNTKRNPSQAI